MTTSTLTGWRRTLDGRDVFTEDGEWYWYDDAQGWFHEPHLVLAPTTPPARVRARTEYRRLRHGWPQNGVFRSLFTLHSMNHPVDAVFGILARAAIVYMLVWKPVMDWGVENVARAWQKFLYSSYLLVTGKGAFVDCRGADCWWSMESKSRGDAEDEFRMVVILALFVLIALCLWYGLYIDYVKHYDTHKALALFAIPLAARAMVMMRNGRVNEMARAIRQSGTGGP